MSQPAHSASDSVRTPPLSLFFGYAAMAPLLLAAAVVLAGPQRWTAPAIHVGIVWAGSVLALLAGVRRGLSFDHEGGPTRLQILTMLWLFALAFVALLVARPVVSLPLLLIGFVGVAALDPVAARRGQAPRFFARLRPPQMAVALVSLLVLLAAALLRR